MHERQHSFAELLEARPPAEFRQVDDEAAADDIAAGALHQLDRRFRRAPGRDQIVDDEHIVAR